ncbi:MAG: MFS transporter [Gammaproteobacteria bacterium]|nr:MFS transporter [Gammaproteobacteria bacterium]
MAIDNPTDPTSQRRLRRNLFTIRVMAFFQVFLVIVPVAVPLFGDRGLSMAEILQLQAIFGISVVVMEIPSGYIADVFGRRMALILGGVFVGVGHSLLLVGYDFFTLALFELALGVGLSLISGADVAVLYDTQIELGDDAQARQKGLGSLFLLRSISEAAAGITASVVLWLGTLSELVWLQVLVGWLPLLFALKVVEPNVERMPAGAHLGNLKFVLGRILGGGKVLRLTFLAMGMWTLTTYYAVWLLQQHWLESDVELTAFGVLWALFSVAAGVAGWQAANLERRLGASWLLALVAMLPVVGYLGLALAPAAWAMVLGLLFFVARGAGFVLLQEAFNRRLEGRYRATANSLVSFLARGAVVVTVPAVGALLGLWSLREVFALLALLSLGLALLLLLPLVVAIRKLPRDLAQTSAGSGGSP